MTRKISLGITFILVFGIVSVARADVIRECEFDRGTFCMLQSQAQFEFRIDRKLRTGIWKIYGDGSNRESFFVIEPRSRRCGRMKELVLSQKPTKIQWEGDTWSSVTIADGEQQGCAIQIIYRNYLSGELSSSFTFSRTEIRICTSENGGTRCAGPVLGEFMRTKGHF